MTIALESLTSLDPDQVTQNLAQTVTTIIEDNPTLDLRPGVLFSLLAYYHAILATQQQANVTDYLNAQSLLAINTDPSLADPSLVDNVLSNYLLTRNPGAAATGDVVIVVSSPITVTIGIGTGFTANGLQFTSVATYTAKALAAQVISANDRLLTEISSGNYAFTITVVATVVGASSMIANNTTVVPASLPPSYVTSYAASDFIGGLDEDTNAALLTRLQQGIAAKCLSNRVTSAALLRSISAFSNFVAISITGMGDPEMVRDKHSIFPIAAGGRVDWYLRTQGQVYQQALTKTATLIAQTGDGYGIWQFAVLRDDAPGFYEITAIQPAGSIPGTVTGEFTITSDTRGLDLNVPGFIPDILDPFEGAYTRFQTAIIQFEDTTTVTASLALGTQQSYNLAARCMPLIGMIQDYISAPAVRDRATDCLVRAAIPCFVSLTLTINKQSGEVDPDVTSITQGLCDAVNAVGFVGRLYAANLQDVVGGYLTGGTYGPSAIDMLGRIRNPDGTTRWLRSSNVLIIPHDETNMVSPRTVQFFAAVADVAITIRTAIPLDA